MNLSDNKKFRQRVRLGIRYITRYQMDEIFNSFNHNYSAGKPLDILCEITYNCNLKCPTCFRWTSRPDENELGLEAWKSIIVKLKKWLGVFNLTFSGGDF